MASQRKKPAFTPSELAGIHIVDPNHRISEQEIMNLKVGAEVNGRSQIKKLYNEKYASGENQAENTGEQLPGE
jgi:hypothetical protein